MKMNFKKALLGATMAASLAWGATASAAVILNDWTVHFGAVGGPSVFGIDAMGFNDAPVNATLHDNDLSGTVTIGDTYTILGKGTIGTFNNDDTGVIAVPGLNAATGFEMTFDFNLEVLVNAVGPAPGTFAWTHIASSDALRVYIDDLSDGGKSTPGTGVGYTDGLQVLTFGVLAGDGGGANTAGSLDGNDDATFALETVDLAGVFQDSDGNELNPGELIAITDSNFDIDSNNNGLFDETRGGFGCTAANQSPGFFCAVEDGTVRLAAVVPEPASLSLLGIGLLGIAGLGRRRKTNV